MRDVVREFDRIAVKMQVKVSRRMYQKMWTYAADHKLSLAAVMRAGLDTLLANEKEPAP